MDPKNNYKPYGQENDSKQLSQLLQKKSKIKKTRSSR